MQLVRDIHYPTCLDFKFHKLYFVWIEYEKEELLTDIDLKIIAFKTEEKLLQYWNTNIREEYKEVFTYNIFTLQQWLLFPHLKFQYDDFLNFWNLFTDVSESTKIKFIGDEKEEVRNAVYDKLFNASGVFIADEPNPIFSDVEFEMLVKVMQNGLDLLLNNLIIIENATILP